MHRVTLPDGTAVPALGLGTWRLGESAPGSATRATEVAALRLALDLGYRLIDTAEMYGEGGAEEAVGAALRAWIADGGRRDDVFVVSKVYPHNASRRGTVAACKRSLARLGLDRIDLYLLHWRGQHPLADTVAAMQSMVKDGLIRHWGVSNFDTDDMAALWRVPAGEHCAVNQIYYSARERGCEFDLLPWLRARGVATMAYCPIDRGRVAQDAAMRAIGARHGVTATQAALAWVLRQPGVIAIPKAVRETHLRDNLAAASLVLDDADLVAVDRAHPAPTRKQPLAMS